jgi:hypothetical protein
MPKRTRPQTGQRGASKQKGQKGKEPKKSKKENETLTLSCDKHSNFVLFQFVCYNLQLIIIGFFCCITDRIPDGEPEETPSQIADMLGDNDQSDEDSDGFVVESSQPRGGTGKAKSSHRQQRRKRGRSPGGSSAEELDDCFPKTQGNNRSSSGDELFVSRRPQPRLFEDEEPLEDEPARSPKSPSYSPAGSYSDEGSNLNEKIMPESDDEVPLVIAEDEVPLGAEEEVV